MFFMYLMLCLIFYGFIAPFILFYPLITQSTLSLWVEVSSFGDALHLQEPLTILFISWCSWKIWDHLWEKNDKLEVGSSTGLSRNSKSNMDWWKGNGPSQSRTLETLQTFLRASVQLRLLLPTKIRVAATQPSLFYWEKQYSFLVFSYCKITRHK